ncbi:DUF4244 domain-containing protein [Litorihabitans aurantiacus]|uniref:DUF4244 domain-containing protein n=1 Tax=Litorihabitans aurantiacus TaxID=1930061 RepID=UPI003D670AB7
MTLDRRPFVGAVETGAGVDDGRSGLDGDGHVCDPRATGAAVAFAGLLLVIMRSGEVREMLMGIVREALSR